MNSPVLKTSARMVDNNSKELNEAVQCKKWGLESVPNMIQLLNSNETFKKNHKYPALQQSTT